MIVRCKAKDCKYYDGGCSLNFIDIGEDGECEQAEMSQDWWSRLDEFADTEDKLNELMKDGGVR